MPRRVRTATILFLTIVARMSLGADVEVVLQDGRFDYTGTQDTQLGKGNNVGRWEQFGIWQYDEPALIRFDLSLIPSSAKVKSASLELFFKDCGFSEYEIRRSWPVEVYVCEVPWVEGTGHPEAHTHDGASIETTDGTTPWPGGKVTVSPSLRLGRTTIAGGQERRWYRWALNTQLVQKWIDGQLKNNGMVIVGRPPGKAVAFFAREDTEIELRPTLRLLLMVPDSDAGSLLARSDSRITWEQFLGDCGLKAQEANQARTEKVFREKYLGKIIRWTGTVYSVQERNLSSGYTIHVLMQPTESVLGGPDLTLIAGERFKEQVLALNKGDVIRFSGNLIEQGGRILNHQIELTSLQR